WSGPRFFALARSNGRPPAHGPNKTWARAARNGPATGSNKASLPLQTAHMRNPEAIGVGYASLLERLSQTCPGLLSDCAACGVLDGRAHRLSADPQGHRQSPAPAAQL